MSAANDFIDSLGTQTKFSIDYTDLIRHAFTLGLWYSSFPDYMVGDLQRCHPWDLTDIDKAASDDWSREYYPNMFRFMFISDTGTSWHQCYRDLRSRGWRRLKVHRQGGALQYLFSKSDESKPLGFEHIHLLLGITISTCKQVLVKTEMKEIPVYETVCEDLKEIVEESDPDPKDNITF